MRIKSIVFCILVSFSTILHADSSNQSINQETYATDNFPKYLKYDWTKISPVEFLRNLKDKKKGVVTIYNYPPKDWITEVDVSKLMQWIDSNDSSAIVVSIFSSYFPKEEKSTVGNEAMFLIEGFKKGKYPSALCSVHYFKGDPNEYRNWWKQYKNHEMK